MVTFFGGGLGDTVKWLVDDDLVVTNATSNVSAVISTDPNLVYADYLAPAADGVSENVVILPGYWYGNVAIELFKGMILYCNFGGTGIAQLFFQLKL